MRTLSKSKLLAFRQCPKRLHTTGRVPSEGMPQPLDQDIEGCTVPTQNRPKCCPHFSQLLGRGEFQRRLGAMFTTAASTR